MPGSGDRIARWWGGRWVFWPRGIPPGRRIGLVSSRFGAPDRLGRHWYSRLRRICTDVRNAGHVLLTVPGTSLADLLARCSERFQLPLISAQLPPPGLTFDHWLCACVEGASGLAQGGSWCWPAWVSPPRDVETPSDLTPPRDALLVAASQRILVLRLRRGGHVLGLLQRRLTEEPPSASSRVTVLAGDDFTSHQLARELAAQGAVVWDGGPTGAAAPARRHPASPPAPQAHSPILALADLPREPDPGAFLIHCTRGTHAPWPDQTRDDYLDDLILDREAAIHTPLATLHKILLERRLRATSWAIRGGTPVVCFTAAELTALGQLRAFRPHRHRWDFEPFGIGIARRWLVPRGTRPVVYGDEACWQGLSDDQRPFFQCRRGGQRGQFDWSREQEWRHPGDVDLTNVPVADAFVFVPSPRDADDLAAMSPWPIVVLG